MLVVESRLKRSDTNHLLQVFWISCTATVLIFFLLCRCLMSIDGDMLRKYLYLDRMRTFDNAWKMAQMWVALDVCESLSHAALPS